MFKTGRALLKSKKEEATIFLIFEGTSNKYHKNNELCRALKVIKIFYSKRKASAFSEVTRLEGTRFAKCRNFILKMEAKGEG